MLMDGMVEGWPDNDRLLLAAARTYSSFASAFVTEDDPAFRDVLLSRSKTYALRALEQRGLERPLTSPFDGFEAALKRTTGDDLPYLFWAGSCWAACEAPNPIRSRRDLERVVEAVDEDARSEFERKRRAEEGERSVRGRPARLF